MDVLPTTADLLSLREPELDRLFRESPAGPIPDGDGLGTVLLLPGTAAGRAIAWVTRLLIWQGKVVDRPHGRLRNKITPLGLRRIPAEVRRGPSLIDGDECVILDYARVRGPAGGVRDELRLVGPGLYLGMIFYYGRHLGAFTLRFGARRAGRD